MYICIHIIYIYICVCLCICISPHIQSATRGSRKAKSVVACRSPSPAIYRGSEIERNIKTNYEDVKDHNGSSSHQRCNKSSKKTEEDCYEIHRRLNEVAEQQEET